MNILKYGQSSEYIFKPTRNSTPEKLATKSFFIYSENKLTNKYLNIICTYIYLSFNNEEVYE